MSLAVCAYSFSSSCLSSALESIVSSQLAQKEATGNLISTLRTSSDKLLSIYQSFFQKSIFHIYNTSGESRCADCVETGCQTWGWINKGAELWYFSHTTQIVLNKFLTGGRKVEKSTFPRNNIYIYAHIPFSPSILFWYDLIPNLISLWFHANLFWPEAHTE